MGSAPLAQLPVQDVLERLSAADAHAGGERAAAVACALAATLVEHVARGEDSPLAVARLARSSALRERVLALAADERPDGAEPEPEPTSATRARAALAIGSSAAALTSLAAECCTAIDDEAVADAIAAAELADGACRAAVHLVRIGLRNSPGDPRRTEAASLVNASAEALQDAFAEAAARARPDGAG